MPGIRSNLFLRRAMLADAAISGATALLMIAGAGLAARLLSLPEPLLRYAGLILVPYVAFVVFAGTRETISTPAVWTIIVSNVLWAAASILVLVTGWVSPNALGYAFVIAQAAIVALFAEVQYAGIRRSEPAAA